MKQLQVRIGSSLESLSLINPNDESNPVKISNDYFKGQALMWIKNFRGKVPNGQETIANSEYFNGKKHRFSLLVQGEFLKKYTAEDIVWTAQWEKPLNIPSYFTKFWHMVAPHSMVDLSGPAPYVQSFAITASSIIQTWDHVLDKLSLKIIEDINSIIPSHVEMKKKKSYFYTQETMMVSARRRLFCIKENRESILFGPAFETYNNYFDPNTFHVNVLGAPLDANLLLNDQPLRLFLKSKDDESIFLCLELNLAE